MKTAACRVSQRVNTPSVKSVSRYSCILFSLLVSPGRRRAGRLTLVVASYSITPSNQGISAGPVERELSSDPSTRTSRPVAPRLVCTFIPPSLCHFAKMCKKQKTKKERQLWSHFLSACAQRGGGRASQQAAPPGFHQPPLKLTLCLNQPWRR